MKCYVFNSTKTRREKKVAHYFHMFIDQKRLYTKEMSFVIFSVNKFAQKNRSILINVVLKNVSSFKPSNGYLLYLCNRYSFTVFILEPLNFPFLLPHLLTKQKSRCHEHVIK